MGDHITTQSWPTASVASFRNLDEVPAGSLQLLGSPADDLLWHRPLRAGVAKSDAVLIEAKCGLRWRHSEGRQAPHAPDLCHQCWPRYEVPQSRKLLGHYIETESIRLDTRSLSLVGSLERLPPLGMGHDPSVRPLEWKLPFVLALLDVADGVRTTYRGLMTAQTPQNIAGTTDPFADYAQYATKVAFTSVSVETHGDPDVLNERIRRASEQAIQNLAATILKTAPDGRTPTAPEVAAALHRSHQMNDARIRRDEILQRVAQLVEQFDGEKNWVELVRSDPTLQELAGRTYTRSYVRVLKMESARAGYLPTPKPRGRSGGRKRSTPTE